MRDGEYILKVVYVPNAFIAVNIDENDRIKARSVSRDEATPMIWMNALITQEMLKSRKINTSIQTK